MPPTSWSSYAPGTWPQAKESSDNGSEIQNTCGAPTEHPDEDRQPAIPWILREAGCQVKYVVRDPSLSVRTCKD